MMRKTKKMQTLIAENKFVDAIVQFRKDNPGVSIIDAQVQCKEERAWLTTYLLTRIAGGDCFGVDGLVEVVTLSKEETK